jgi:hypothetical protein
VRSEDSLAQEILNEKDETYVYRFGYFDFVLAKEASWGGDRKIKETIIASPRIDIVPSAGRFSSNFKHFKEKRRKKTKKMVSFCASQVWL